MFTIPKDVYKSWIGIIGKIRPEVELVIDNNVYLCTTDTAKVAMLELTLNVEPDEKTVFQFNVSSLLSINPKEDVEVFMEDTRVYFKVGSTKYKITKLADLQTHRTIPFKEFEGFTAKFVLTGELLTQVQQMAKIIAGEKDPSDAIVFEVNDTIAQIKNKRMEQGIEIDIPREFVSFSEPARVCYPQDYIADLFAYAHIFDVATVEFKTDFPCIITYPGDLLQARVLIAPRIEAE